MNREEALKLLKENIDNTNLRKHCLAVEAIMRRLASRFGEDEEEWGLCGLLHDIDYEKTKNSPEKHSLVGAQMLEDLGIKEEIVEAVKTHNEMHGIKPKGLMAKSLFVCDPLSGLIVASALISPSKKLSGIDADFVLRRFDEKDFARGANREIIKKCEPYLDLELQEFVALCLGGMQDISSDLGL